MSKKLYTLLASLVITVGTFAQAPEKMSYQAVVRNAGGDLVSDQAVGMQISILQGSISGPAVYTETQTPTTNVNGLVTLEIGTGTTTDDFSIIDWAAGPYFIKTETDPTGGSSYTITGTSQLMSVPYALHSNTATTADNGIPSGGTEGQVLSIVGGVVVWVDHVLDFDGDGYAISEGDCNDNDPTINPDNIWYLDADNDGYAASTIAQCGSPGAGYTLTVLPETDCDDANASINPSVIEILGNTIDDNCDGQIDEVNIGQARDGGIIFYVAPIPTDLDGDGDLDTGLVCAVEDQSTGIQWSNGSAVVTGATVGVIGAGSANTDAIIAVQGSVATNYAAGLARSYSGGGYADWFLPSKDELDQIYLIRATLESVPGFAPFGNTPATDIYWSSTETINSLAWIRNFAVGISSTQLKTNTYKVRAVRAF
jgi:hypothetical protein